MMIGTGRSVAANDRDASKAPVRPEKNAVLRYWRAISFDIAEIYDDIVAG